MVVQQELIVSSSRKEKAKEYEGEVVKIIAATHPTWRVYEPASDYSRVDGIAIDNRTQQLIAVWETKCRNKSLYEIQKYGNELVIDNHKLESLKKSSWLFCVETYLFTYLLRDGLILKTKITNDKGEYVCIKRDADEEGSAGLNRGTIQKTHSYVKIDGSTILSTGQPIGSI
jgi:hypothetical protein